jgi:hypothetical protein
MQDGAGAFSAERMRRRHRQTGNFAGRFAFPTALLCSRHAAHMIPNLLRLLTRRPPADYERGFVEEVRLLDHLPPRNPRVEKLILFCWILIVLKCWLVVWLVGKYHMKFDPLWVNAPTVMAALMCTGAYFLRE